MDERLRVDLLPPLLREVAEVIGVSATLRLVAWRGGLELWVPARVDAAHPLAQQLGIDAARRLCERYALEKLWIPMAARAIRAARNAEIIRRYRDGERVVDLATEYRTSDRHILRIVAGHRRRCDERQRSLL